MSESYTQLPPDSVGKRLRTLLNTIGAQDVHAEVVSLADPDGTLASPSTFARDSTLTAGLGTDGATPPTIAGSGIRGWLRAIYDRLVAGVAVTQGGAWTVTAANLDLSITALRDALRGTGNKTYTDLDADLATLAAALGSTGDLASASTVIGRLKTIVGRLDVDLSTRASESTLTSALNTLTGILARLDVQSSSRASEATLAAGIGAQGTGPPGLNGSSSGLLGYLRTILDRVNAGLGRTWNLNSGVDSVTVVGSVSTTPVAALRDYDTGVGTDQEQVSGLIFPAAGGAVLATGDTAFGLDVDVTRSALPAGAATESTLAAAKVDLDTLVTRTDVLCSTRASEVTLAALEADVADMDGRFYRLLNQHVANGYEMRTDLGVTDQYFAMAPDATATSSASWDVLRIYLTAGSPVRWRTRTGVAWDSRTIGWT